LVREQHDARCVYDDVHASEGLLGLVEQRGHCDLVGDVGLDRDRPATGPGDLLDRCVGLRFVTAVGDDHGVPVAA
jgi:hypothetical protein